jgi:hypothetical protein
MPSRYIWAPSEIPPKCKLQRLETEQCVADAEKFIAEFLDGIEIAPMLADAAQPGVWSEPARQLGGSAFRVHLRQPGRTALDHRDAGEIRVATVDLGRWRLPKWSFWSGCWPLPAGGCRWSNARTPPKASPCSLNAGSSNAPSPRSAITAAPPKTTNTIRKLRNHHLRLHDPPDVMSPRLIPQQVLKIIEISYKNGLLFLAKIALTA